MLKKMSAIALATIVVFSACQKKSDKIYVDEVKPSTEETSPEIQEGYGLGLLMHDEADYAKFKRADVNAIVKRAYQLKGVTRPRSVASSYTIPGPPVGTQGGKGSCVAWAAAYAAVSALEHGFNGTPYPDATRSPEFVYNQIKVSSTSCTSGSYLSWGLKLIEEDGVCSMSEMPYTDTGCSIMPNATQIAAAANHKITSWAVVQNNDVDTVKALIGANLPVMISIYADSVFYAIGKTDTAIWNTRGGKNFGGHAVTIMGYDDVKQAFKVQNSWGSAWGDNGYCWLKYDFFAKDSASAAREAYVAYME